MLRKFKRLILEIHRRSLWQVLAIYLATCWVVLQVAEHVIEQFSMPEWAYGAALLLLLVGLPVVLATAVVQEGGPPGGHGEAGAADEGRGGGPPPHGQEGLSGYLTWRNAILGGVGASIVWALLVVAWVTFGAESIGPALTLRESSDEAAERPASRTIAMDDSLDETRGTGERRIDAPDTTSEAPPTGTEAALNRRASDPEDAPRSPDRGPAVPPPAPASLLRASSEADEARREAVEAGAATMATETLRLGDSLRELASREAAMGRYGSAERSTRLGLEAYRGARERAVGIWTSRLDSIRGELEALRTTTDSLTEAYAEASTRQREATRREEAGDYAGALVALEDAATLYRRARPRTPERSARADSGAAEPSPPEPREVVAEGLARLRGALEAEDIQALRRTWVTLSAGQARNFERFFEAGRDFQVEFEIQWETLTESSGRVAVQVQTAWRYYDENARRRVDAPPFEQTMVFEQRDGRWVIATP